MRMMTPMQQIIFQMDSLVKSDLSKTERRIADILDHETPSSEEKHARG